MAAGHVVVCEAMEAAALGRPEPGRAYLKFVPRSWAMAAGPGSANIPWMAYEAARAFGRADDELLRSYVAENERRYQLSEPLSWKYSPWTVTTCATAIHLDTRRAANRPGAILAHPLSGIMMQWTALCLLMEARTARNLRVVVLCGCRSWGENDGFDEYMGETWRVICGDQRPKRYRKAVSWAGTALTVPGILEVFRTFRDSMAHLSPRALWEHVRMPMRAPFQFIGYEDGSRCCIMGHDEEEFVDEDTNSNTPGVLLYRATRTAMLALPECPAPNTGKRRIRQTAMQADIDWNASIPGWRLVHSHIGRVAAADKWLSDARELPSRRLFHFEILPSGERIDHLARVQPPVPPPPSIAPQLGEKKRKRHWWEFWK